MPKPFGSSAKPGGHLLDAAALLANTASGSADGALTIELASTDHTQKAVVTVHIAKMGCGSPVSG
jgi:hypothetical protein